MAEEVTLQQMTCMCIGLVSSYQHWQRQSAVPCALADALLVVQHPNLMCSVQDRHVLLTAHAVLHSVSGLQLSLHKVAANILHVRERHVG